MASDESYAAELQRAFSGAPDAPPFRRALGGSPEPTLEFYVELRPPGSSDITPSAYVWVRGDTRDEALLNLRVPDGWAVYVKRERLVEYRVCATCGTDEEVKHRSRKQGFGMVAFLECGHFQNDDEY